MRLPLAVDLALALAVASGMRWRRLRLPLAGLTPGTVDEETKGPEGVVKVGSKKRRGEKRSEGERRGEERGGGGMYRGCWGLALAERWA